MIAIRRRAAALGLLTFLVGAGCASGSTGPDPGYSVALETQPAPMQNSRVATVMLRVQQSNGAPLTGAKVSFIPEHTGMGHSKPTINTQEREPGVYSAEYMPPMAGQYRVTVVVEGSQGKVERALDATVL
jgi:hypothetical protein